MCVRVAVVAFLRVRGLFALRVETLAAAAGGPAVRFAHEEAASATPTVRQASLQGLAHVPPFGSKSKGFVHVTRSLVALAHLELDLPVPAFPRPFACPVDERLADALVPVIRRDPDVIEERVRLRRQEPALAQDHVAEGLAGRPFRDPPFRPIAFHERFDLLPEVVLPRPAIEPRSLVLGQVIPYGLQGRGPDPCEVRATRAAHAEIDGSTTPSSSAPVNDEDVGRPSPCRLLSRPSLATQNLYGARPVRHTVPPSRCVRCGAVSRDYLCASCIDYLTAYHPLWLNPALLPGPSLLDLVAPRESPLVSSDLGMIEWESPRSEPSAADAVQLIRLLGLDSPIVPTLSVGDADLLHRFLRDTRRS